MPQPARKQLKQLKLRQLDASLKPFQDLRSAPPPRLGWLAEVRTGLGMTAAQLGHRLGVTKQRIGVMERAEAEGKLTLASLERAARALGCDLVYAVVPRGSLEAMVDQRAQTVAAALVRRTAHSMWLERQEPSDEESTAQIKGVAEHLKAAMSSRLWDSSADES